MTFYAPFCLPFIIGAAVMFAVLAWKWGTWLYRLPRADKKRILFGLPTRRTFGAAWEVVSESLLHRRIFRVNPLLGYMHMSLAFGWFLLIAVGWAETIAYLGFRYVPLQGHVFFKYFATGLEHKPFFDFTMDLLLLFVLSGVGWPGASVSTPGRWACGARRSTSRATGWPCRRCGSCSRRVWWPKAPRARFTAAGDSSPGASGSGCPGISA